MGTHAIVAVKDKKGAFKSAYVHYDGYEDYTGQCLVKYWNSWELANKLVDLGGVSCLKGNMELTELEAYADEPAQTHHSIVGLKQRAEDCWAFLYIFDEEKNEWNITNRWNEDTYNFFKQSFLV